MARSTYIYIVTSEFKSDEIYGLFTVKREAIWFMKRDAEKGGEDWRKGYTLMRSRDGKDYDPVWMNLYDEK